MKVAIGLFMLFLYSQALAGIIHVPADIANIQTAIDSASAGDTILVAPGTYTGSGNRDIDTKGKALLLRGTGGPDSTTIDCDAAVSDPHRGFHIWQGEDSTTTIEGFQVINGVAWYPFNEDEFGPSGGGIRCAGSSPRIVNCKFTYCNAQYGGGISCTDSAMPVFERCEIAYSLAQDLGAGTSVNEGSSVRFLGCSWHHNSTHSGAALDVENAFVRLDSCLLYRNSAADYTAAVMAVRSSVELFKCTIVDNYADGATVLWSWGGHLALYRSLIAFNQGGSSHYISGLTDSLIVQCCDIYGNAGGDWIGYFADYLDVDGNMSADPQFCSRTLRDFHLSTVSPCLPESTACASLVGALGIGCVPTDVSWQPESEENAAGVSFSIYPNPANSTASISISLPVAAVVSLEIYNLLGQRVATLISNLRLPAGQHTITWDAETAASGLYLYRLTTPAYQATRKMLLLK